MRKIIATSAFCLFTFSLFSQDVHFSQFNLSPLTLNPALASAGCDMRGLLNYKSQWKSVTVPFRTIAFSYEMALLKKKWKNGYLGMGVSDFNDKAGNSKMGMNQFNFSLSAVRKLDKKNSLSTGL